MILNYILNVYPHIHRLVYFHSSSRKCLFTTAIDHYIKQQFTKMQSWGAQSQTTYQQHFWIFCYFQYQSPGHIMSYNQAIKAMNLMFSTWAYPHSGSFTYARIFNFWKPNNMFILYSLSSPKWEFLFLWGY